MTNKVLIVEDEDKIREEVREGLIDEGYDCVEAANGEQGLDLIRRDPEIAVVLADFQMPSRSGLEMITAAKAETGWSKERQRIILLAAPLHDVGKTGTPLQACLRS